MERKGRLPSLTGAGKPRLDTAATVGLILLALVVIGAVLAPVLTPYEYGTLDTDTRTEPPSWEHPLGTDRFGRDQLTRILYGARVSLLIGMLAVGIAAALGLLTGIAAGYYGGLVDSVLMRLMDSVAAIPYLLIATLIAIFAGFTARGTTIAIGISLVPDFAALARALVLNTLGKGFLEAERAFGIPDSVILFRHVLPNIISQYIAKFTNAFAEAVLAVTTLGYLNYAVQPPYPEWGDLLADGYIYIVSGQWWLTVFPGLAILITVVSVNLLGNGLSRLIDSRAGANGGRS